MSCWNIIRKQEKDFIHIKTAHCIAIPAILSFSTKPVCNFVILSLDYQLLSICIIKTYAKLEL